MSKDDEVKKVPVEDKDDDAQRDNGHDRKVLLARSPSSCHEQEEKIEEADIEVLAYNKKDEHHFVEEGIEAVEFMRPTQNDAMVGESDAAEETETKKPIDPPANKAEQACQVRKSLEGDQGETLSDDAQDQEDDDAEDIDSAICCRCSCSIGGSDCLCSVTHCWYRIFLLVILLVGIGVTIFLALDFKNEQNNRASNNNSNDIPTPSPLAREYPPAERGGSPTEYPSSLSTPYHPLKSARPTLFFQTTGSPTVHPSISNNGVYTILRNQESDSLAALGTDVSLSEDGRRLVASSSFIGPTGVFAAIYERESPRQSWKLVDTLKAEDHAEAFDQLPQVEMGTASVRAAASLEQEGNFVAARYAVEPNANGALRLFACCNFGLEDLGPNFVGPLAVSYGANETQELRGIAVYRNDDSPHLLLHFQDRSRNFSSITNIYRVVRVDQQLPTEPLSLTSIYGDLEIEEPITSSSDENTAFGFDYVVPMSMSVGNEGRRIAVVARNRVSGCREVQVYDWSVSGNGGVSWIKKGDSIVTYDSNACDAVYRVLLGEQDGSANADLLFVAQPARSGVSDGVGYVFMRRWDENIQNWVLESERMNGGATGLGETMAYGGNRLVIGEPYYSTDELSSIGRVHVIERSQQGLEGFWSDMDIEGIGDIIYGGTKLGSSVSISADGKTVAVGSPGYEADLGRVDILYIP